MVNIRIKKSRQSAKVMVCSAKRFREGMMVMKVGSFRITEVGEGHSWGEQCQQVPGGQGEHCAPWGG